MISILIFYKIKIKKILGNLICDKEIVFTVVLSDSKEENPKFESSFNQYNDYQHILKMIMKAVMNVSNFINVFLNSKINIPMISKKLINVIL